MFSLWQLTTNKLERITFQTFFAQFGAHIENKNIKSVLFQSFLRIPSLFHFQRSPKVGAKKPGMSFLGPATQIEPKTQF